MAIHEQNYVRYDGPLRQTGAWWTIARTSLRTYLSFLRTKLVLLGLWVIGPLVAGVLILVEYGARGQLAQFTEITAPSGDYVTYFLQMQAFGLAVLFMANGCGVISEDLRYRTFQLFFSKPLSRLDYALGKYLSLLLLGSLITVLPATLLATLRCAFFVQSEFFASVAKQMAIGVGMSALITCVMAAIVIGLSSLTSRTGYVVLSWIGVLMVPLILSGIVGIATDGAEWANLWSLTGSFMVASKSLLSEEVFDGPIWVAWAVLFGTMALGLFGLAQRIRTLEGVA
jgi:ABC-2 type transport system permease protein